VDVAEARCLSSLTLLIPADKIKIVDRLTYDNIQSDFRTKRACVSVLNIFHMSSETGELSIC